MKERLHHWRLANPLAVMAVAAVAGVMAADHLALAASLWLGITAVIAMALGCWRPGLWKFVPAVALSFAFLHGLRLQDTYTHPLRERLLENKGNKPIRVAVQGRLFPWPDSVEKNESRAGCEVIKIRWEGKGDFESLPVRVKVSLPVKLRLHEPGIYEMAGVLSLPKAPLNPGQFDAVNYSLRMGWVAELRAHTLHKVRDDPWPIRFHLLRGASACRAWMSRALSFGLDPASKNTGVILAMALGASDAAGDEIEDSFRNSGTLHVFAVSGMHVVVVIMVFGFILRLLGVGKAREAWFLIGLVFIYAYVTGWQPSAARAAFMISIVVMAPLVNRQAALQNNLGAAALILLAVDSHQLFMPGFQLSFGVLWAIAFAATPLTNRLRPWADLDPMLPSTLATRSQRAGSSCKRWTAALVSVSSAAWLGSLPLLLANFHTVTPVALVANCILVPLSSFCIIFACMSCGFAGIGFTWGQWLANQINTYLAHGMVVSATWFASWPLANIHVGLQQDQQAAAPVEMRVFQLPGGGAANHLRNGDSHWLLDCGNANAWRRVLQPYLRQQGVNQLDGMILSHGDADHVGAAPLVFKDMQVPQFHTSQHEPWRYDQPASSMRRLSLIAAPGGGVWRKHRADETIPLGEYGALPLSATILHPIASDVHEKADDRSLVLMIHAGAIRVLWMGDAGFVTEKELLARHVSLRCDILIRNQHSADASGLTEFLLAAQPQAIISSNDSTLSEEQMPPRVRAYCEEKGIPLFDLGAGGSVGIAFEKNRASLQAFGDGQRATVNAR